MLCSLTNFFRIKRAQLPILGSLSLLAWLAGFPQAAQSQTVLPSVPNLNFQTSGPSRCDNVGDWYTTTNNNNSVATCNTPNAAASTTNPVANRLHRFLISITAQDLINAGGSIVVSVLDAESNGARDEVNATPFGSTTCATAAVGCDPTRFALLNPAGATIQTVTVPSGSADGTTVTFPAIATPGVYQVASETGAGPISGDSTSLVNNDDNSFTIQVSAVTDLLIGQFQGSVQQNTGAPASFSFYFLTGPGTGSLFLRNFDLDNGGTINYLSPPGGVGAIAGISSGNGRWNAPPPTTPTNLNIGGDTVSGLSTINDAGTWTLGVAGFTSGNQTIFEINTGAGARLPLFDRPPQRAGNFTITPSTTLATTIGTPVDHPFTVTNNFFTTDIVNLALVAAGGSDPNYTVQLLTSGGTPLTDTDEGGSGAVDTGILQVGQTASFILRVTPNAGAVNPNIVNINATSFIDREVRAQAGTGAPTVQSVTKTTTLPAVGAIGDLVFNDLNGNGIQEVGELGRAGVTVTLRDSGGNVVTTLITDANGNYQFTNVPVGNYSVTITPPAGFGATTPNPQNVSLTAGQTITNVDFGLQPVGSIGDRVFNDFDGNGSQNGAEPGFAGVTLTLRNSSGTVVGTTITDGAGNYQFANVFAGNYTVTATPPAGFTTTTLNPQPVTLAAGQAVTTVDFGLRQVPGSIGDLVFNDLNGNGTQEAGETGRAGATVTLTGTDVNSNAVNLSIVTDANGNYQFANLLPGNYTATLTPPPGFALTTTNPQPITLTAGQVITTVDFGVRRIPGNIGDTVFNDLDGSGVQTAGEAGLVGVTVTLSGTDSNGDPVALTTTTNATGNYQFTNVLAGTYTVTVTPPATFTATTPNPQSVTLAAGQTLANVDFGLRQAPGTIGDRVFNDLNGDGIQNGAELGLAGVTVTLTDGVGNTITTTTNASGGYQFTGVAPGNYTVTITPLAGFGGTTPTTQTLTLNPGQGIDTIDFGLRQPPGTIGNLVFNDLNGNGTQDPGELGLAGSILTLTDGAGNVVGTTTTDANGNYQFANLPPGTYTVTAAPPAGFTALPPNPQTITLAAGQTLDTVDFAMRQVPGTIGDRVFNDLNGNGVQDGTEPGLGGVTLTLQNAAGTAIATVVTDASGNYQFTNTPPGTYTVVISAPVGLNLTTNNPTVSVTLTAGQSITNVDFGLRAGQARLRLVKRITNVLRLGAPIGGINFGSVVDDPADSNDTATGWSQLPLVGVPRIDASTPLQSGDEIEYTVYFLSDGGSPTLTVNFCDLVQPQTIFVSSSIQVKVGTAAPTAGGTFLTPLAPLPTGNACSAQGNPNGAIVVNLGDISNNAGSNFGFIRFRVRVN